MTATTPTTPTQPGVPSLAERLDRIHLLRECSPRDRRIVGRHLELLALPPGTALIRAGDPVTNLFLLLDGELTVSEGQRTWTLGPGGHVGEVGLLRGGPAHQDVATATECEVAVLGARMFHVLCRDLPPFNRALLADLARRC